MIKGNILNLKRFLLLVLVFVLLLLFVFSCNEEKKVVNENKQEEKETAEVVEENYKEGLTNLTQHLSMIVDLGEVYTKTDSCNEIYETALGNQLRSFRFTVSHLTNTALRMEETTPLTKELELGFLHQFTDTLKNSYEGKENIKKANQVFKKHLDELKDITIVDYEELIEEKNQRRIIEILKEIESGLKPTVEDLGINYEDFDPLVNHKLKTLYEYDPGEEDFQEEIRGEYDLNADGTADDIQVIFGTRPYSDGPADQKSRIRVNDTEIETKTLIHTPMGVYIIDFNKEEPFKELVIYDEGPGVSPSKDIYRYNGEELIKLGTITGVLGSPSEEDAEDANEDIPGTPYDKVKADGKGNIIQAWNAVEFISPEIILGVSKIKDENIEDIIIDYNKMLRKEYEIKEDLNVYFKETEKDIRDIEKLPWDEDKIISINKGDKIYLEDICDLNPARYAAELEDGRRGILYFWVGD